MPRVALFDSSLRDGAQAEGITFSVEDKIKILQSLDALGIDYVEAGNPTSNPKDLEFFQRVRGMKLQKARIVAFGSTCHKNCDPVEDMYVNSLLSAQTQAVAIFGKSWDFHVTDIIQTTLEENLRMIRETIRYVKSRDREVIFDAEHFFDGYKANAQYAMEALAAAAEGGADCLVLCDTNGGTMPDEIRRIVAEVRARFPKQSVGIHCHNDCGMAVGNSIEAVLAGRIMYRAHSWDSESGAAMPVCVRFWAIFSSKWATNVSRQRRWLSSRRPHGISRKLPTSL